MTKPVNQLMISSTKGVRLNELKDRQEKQIYDSHHKKHVAIVQL
jgi:hypothetical protein